MSLEKIVSSAMENKPVEMQAAFAEVMEVRCREALATKYSDMSEIGEEITDNLEEEAETSEEAEL
jgi:glutamate-1-semialdehyde aminotransferase